MRLSLRHLLPPVLLFSRPSPTLSATTTTCANTHNGASASNGEKCLQFQDNVAACGTNDDADFNAKRMCCNCDGGETTTCIDTAPEGATTSDGLGCVTFVVNAYACSYPQYTDEFFRPEEMCCGCPSGGLRNPRDCGVGEQPISSTECEPCPVGSHSSTTDFTLCIAC